MSSDNTMATLDIRFSTTGKTKYFGVLLETGEWIRVATKRMAQNLIETITNNYEVKNNDKSTIHSRPTQQPDRQVSLRQGNESINDVSTLSTSSFETFRSNSTTDTQERGDSVLSEPKTGGIERCESDSDTTEATDSITPFPRFLADNSRQIREHCDTLKSSCDTLKSSCDTLYGIARVSIGIARQSISSDVGIDGRESASRIPQIEQHTIDILAE